jgi:hypothetical protein
MPFEMSEKAIFEEETMEAISFYRFFVDDVRQAIEALTKNRDLDFENDKIRAEVTRHLLSALSAHSMRDYDDVNRHINAAIQRLHAQEVTDLSDDRPRTDAMISLSVCSQKALSHIKVLEKFLEKLNKKKERKA